jgi:hypothetical protein
MVLIPFAAFAVAFFGGAAALWFITKPTKISKTEGKSGSAMHVESPLGTLDVHSEARLDPRLAGIPLYPGAMAVNPAAAETVSVAHVGGRTLQDISASYWTPHSEKQVWDFYRQQLPQWPRNLIDARGRELIGHEADCELLIRITQGPDRTVIETSVKPPGYPLLFERRNRG